MSKKFNFNTYFKQAKAKKTDDSYPKMLEEQHKKDAPNALTEKQLAKKDHVKKPLNSTTEKQLSKVRVDEECLSTEGRLNKNKARFDIKHRNKEAFTGNINKIEAQRIGKDKMEDEKYEAASVVPKGMRWWEKEAKIAKLKAELQKLSAKDDLDSYTQDEGRRWEGVAEMGDTPETGVIDADPENEFVGKPQFDAQEDEDVDAVGSRNLFVSDKQEKEVAGIYTLMFKVCYDPSGWEGDMELLKEEVLDKVLSVRPDLEDKISIDDISDRPSVKDGQPCMVFRVVGDEYRPISGDISSGESFKELAYKQDEMDGTPVVKGIYKINNLPSFMGSDGDVDEMAVAKAVADYVDSKHPEIGIEAESIVVDLERKVATFVVEANAGETIPEEFPIIEESAVDDNSFPVDIDEEFDDRFK